METQPNFGTKNKILIVWNSKLETRWCQITSVSRLICFWLISGTDLARASNTVCHDDFQGLRMQWIELDYTWKLYLKSTASSLCILYLLIWLKTDHFACWYGWKHIILHHTLCLRLMMICVQELTSIQIGSTVSRCCQQFYTFKNLVCYELVLAADGQKTVRVIAYLSCKLLKTIAILKKYQYLVLIQFSSLLMAFCCIRIAKSPSHLTLLQVLQITCGTFSHEAFYMMNHEHEWLEWQRA